MAQQLSPPPVIKADELDEATRVALESLLKYLERLRQEVDRRLTAGGL